ncbi:MAG: c-type cytochrome [Dissulfurispiraceae bacterium]
MPIYLIKSLLSIPLTLLVLFGMFTMFEIFGRTEKKHDIEKLRRLHILGGMLYIVLFIVISYFCLDSMARTQAELSPRATVHALLASAVAVLVVIKSFFLRSYRQFYGQARILGLLISVLSILMIGSSAGYYFLVTGWPAGNYIPPKRMTSETEPSKWIVRTDSDSIRRGKQLYDEKCIICHDPHGTSTLGVPGHKGILQHTRLPISKKPVTAENIANQLRNPVGKMPSFAYLSDEDILDIIAFLNTL